MESNMTTRRKEQLQNLCKAILYLTPFFLGWYGTYQLGEGNLIDCAYKTVQLYLMEYSIEAETLNIATQIARIAAPVVTAAFIVSLLHFLVENVRLWWCLKTQDAVAFHGDSSNIDQIQEKLGKRVIVSENPMAFRARKHVLMFNEDVDMYHYIDQHGTELMDREEGKEIFLCSEKILRGCYENHQIIVCNVAESCAREYWKRFPVKMETMQETGEISSSEKILLIGFDTYGQRLLTQAILKNVVSARSAIEYHVCGKYGGPVDFGQNEYGAYLDTHWMLQKAIHVNKVSSEGDVYEVRPRESICENEDTVYFHEASWQKVMGREGRFDRVIICQDQDEKNMEILNELKTFFVTDVCHIKYSDERILKGLWDCEKDGIRAFGVSEELYDPEVILKEKLFDHAKKIHARYFSKYMCDGICQGKSCHNQKRIPVVDEATGQAKMDLDTGRVMEQVEEVRDLNRCVRCPVMLADWNQQNNFIRYSNVAQADHIPEKLRLLLGSETRMETEGVGAKAVQTYRKLSLQEQEGLWEIEHIRWNRYHFMNNWDYAAIRDKKNRKHPLLLSFRELDFYEKAKDADAYLALEELLR